jgi:hypothetical protein
VLHRRRRHQHGRRLFTTVSRLFQKVSIYATPACSCRNHQVALLFGPEAVELRRHTHTHTHTYILIVGAPGCVSLVAGPCLCQCVCMCACACARKCIHEYIDQVPQRRTGIRSASAVELKAAVVNNSLGQIASATQFTVDKRVYV